MEPTNLVPKKFEYNTAVKMFGETGDILVRASDGRGPWGIPFMKWVAKYTRSNYTHAAILFMESGDPWVFEVTDIGTLKLRFIDWVEFAPKGEFAMFRVKGLEDAQKNTVIETIIKLFTADSPYDFTFQDDKALYCTEAACLVYQAAGISLQTPQKIESIIRSFIYDTTSYPAWIKSQLTRLTLMIVKKINAWCLNRTGGVYGLPMDKPLYFVGQEMGDGILGYERLERIL